MDIDNKDDNFTMEDLLNQEIIKLMVGHEIIINSQKVAKVTNVDKFGQADIEEYYSFEDKEFYILVDEYILDFSEKCFYKALELTKSKMGILSKQIDKLKNNINTQKQINNHPWTIFDLPS